jgi:hypothetical protein
MRKSPKLISCKHNLEYPVRNTVIKITIDVELNEVTWRNTEVASEIWMSYPLDNHKVGKELLTEVRVIYDDQIIYIGAICYGDDNYIIQTLKRDTDFNRGDGFGYIPAV